MTPSRFSGVVAVALVSCLLGAGCASERQEEEAPAPTLVVDGVFRRDAARPSATVDALEFRGNQYWLTPSGCNADACKERGTFALDRPNHLLALIVEGTGRKYQLPFEITSTRSAPDVSGSSKPASVAGPLAPIGDLLAGGGEPLVGHSKLTVGSFKLLETSYSLEYDDCGGRDMVTIAKAMCNDFKLPTKAPRIQCILMNDQDNCQSTKQSCLKDTEQNNASSRFDSYREACDASGDRLLDTVSSMNNGLNPFVMTVCCKTYTCAGGVDINGNSVTGKQGQTVCGQDGTKYWCGPGERRKGSVNGRS